MKYRFIAKRSERSTFATLCVIFLTMESENQGLPNRPLLSKFHSQYRDRTTTV